MHAAARRPRSVVPSSRFKIQSAILSLQQAHSSSLMKRCPECRRDYYDDSLLFCLDDGTRLLDGPSSDTRSAISDRQSAISHKQSEISEQQTAILSGTAASRLAPVGSEEEKTAILSSIGSAPDNTNSIAILPFTNISADEENEYFCDGLAEELLNALSKIDELKVAARTSAFSFKGKNADVSDIGHKLKVKNVLEGSVRKSGNKLRITAQLVNASDGYHLWSERYDREMRD